MVGERYQNVFVIQIDASSFAEFEISEFEISRVDCMCDIVSAITAFKLIFSKNNRFFNKYRFSKTILSGMIPLIFFL